MGLPPPMESVSPPLDTGDRCLIPTRRLQGTRGCHIPSANPTHQENHQQRSHLIGTASSQSRLHPPIELGHTGDASNHITTCLPKLQSVIKGDGKELGCDPTRPSQATTTDSTQHTNPKCSPSLSPPLLPDSSQFEREISFEGQFPRWSPSHGRLTSSQLLPASLMSSFQPDPRPWSLKDTASTDDCISTSDTTTDGGVHPVVYCALAGGTIVRVYGN